MATFRVGQRVRIVGCAEPTMKHHVGKEGVIVSESWDGTDLYYDVDVALINSQGRRCDWHPSHLSPIQPDRNRVVAWDSLPIDPRKILEGTEC